MATSDAREVGLGKSESLAIAKFLYETETLFVERPGALTLSRVFESLAQIAEHEGGTGHVIELSPEREALLVAPDRFIEVVAEEGQRAEARQTSGDAAGVAECTGEGEGFLVVRGGIRESLFPERDVTQIPLCRRDAGLIILRHVEGEGGFVPCPSLSDVAAIVHLDDAEILE